MVVYVYTYPGFIKTAAPQTLEKPCSFTYLPPIIIREDFGLYSCSPPPHVLIINKLRLYIYDAISNPAALIALPGSHLCFFPSPRLLLRMTRLCKYICICVGTQHGVDRLHTRRPAYVCLLYTLVS